MNLETKIKRTKEAIKKRFPDYPDEVINNFLEKHLIGSLTAMDIARCKADPCGIAREQHNPSFKEQVLDIEDGLLWSHGLNELVG